MSPHSLTPARGYVWYPCWYRPPRSPMPSRRGEEELEKDSREFTESGREDLNLLRPFGPETAVAASQPMRTVCKLARTIPNAGGREVQPSQLSTGVSKDFTTRLLPEIESGFAPETAPKVATTPTAADLVALHGGRDQLLSVADVAERLAVCGATAYRLCERGELAHVRIVNSIRVRRADIDALIGGSATAAAEGRGRRPTGE